MTTIKATVRNGRLEVDEPLDLPDGTELTIPVPPSLGMPDDDRPETPEEIEEWLRLYDSLEPLEFTPEERAALEAARREDKEFELAHWEERSKMIEKHFP